MKENWFNKVFRAKKLKVLEHHKEVVGFYPVLEQDLQLADTLLDVLEVHKRAWKLGFRNENIGPCPYGMFRTEEIQGMTLDEVYLGGKWGLITAPATFWETQFSEPYGANGFGIPEETSLKEILLPQYKNLLKLNLIKIRNDSQRFLE